MPAKKSSSGLPQEKLDIYSSLVCTHPGLDLKGVKVPYTFFNGHMFSYFEKDGSFGLPEQEREVFLKKYKTTLFRSYGIVKKEFVLVPESLFFNVREFQPWFDKGFAYVHG